jgi:hypothetical protein
MNYKILNAEKQEELVIVVNEFIKNKYAGDETHLGEKWEVVGAPGRDMGPFASGAWFQAVRFVSVRVYENKPW